MVSWNAVKGVVKVEGRPKESERNRKVWGGGKSREQKREVPKRMKDVSQTPMIFYRSMGMYYDMVNAYIKNFKHIHIIYHNDFKNNTSQVVRETLSFLGVSSNYSIDTTKQYNVGGKNWRYNWLRNLFLKASKL